MKTVIGHLEELRKHLIIIAAFFAFFSAIGIIFSGWLLELSIGWLISGMPVKLITTTPFEFIATQVKLGIFLGIIMTVPVIAYQAAKFVKPALGKRHRAWLNIGIPASIILFAAGFAFALFVFLRFGLVFLGNLAPAYGIANYWSIGAFTSTVFLTCIAVGAIFEMPLLAVILSKAGVIRRSTLTGKRRYAYVAIALAAAAITPTPDALNMLIVFVPMMMMLEVSMLLVRK
jgi:sec-independent protein translocase protein TatC